MELEMDRSLIRLPRLSDSEGIEPPFVLTNARDRLHEISNDLAKRATAVARDDRWSPVERQRQLEALYAEATPELSAVCGLIATIEGLAAESEAGILRKAISAYNPARLLAIADKVSQRGREGRLTAILNARAGDLELCAALLSAPASFGIVEDIDSRILASLRDKLIDGVDPSVRQSADLARFASNRLRTGLEVAGSRLRELCRIERPLGERIVRPA